MPKNRAFLYKLLPVLAALLLAAVVLWDLLPQQAARYTTTSFAMGSALNLTLYGGGEEEANVIIADVQALEEAISPNIATSYTAQINQNGAAETSEDYRKWVENAVDISRRTGGTFDITLGALSALWDIGGENQRVPAQKEIEAALSDTGSEYIEIQENQIAIPAGMRLDFGAIGKGMACDAAYAALTGTDVRGAVIASGGSVLLYGENPDGEGWTVGIQHPERENGELIATLSLDAGFVSTSGNYQKYFIQDGRRYCHILDPETGYPAENGLTSVTVVAGTGAESDALATACFVLGYEKSLSVLADFHAEAVFITEDGEIIPTEGLRDKLTIQE